MENQLTLSVSALPEVIKAVFNMPDHLARPLNITGPPGIGKTYVLDQVVKDLNEVHKEKIGLCTFIASSMDITDFHIPALADGRMQFFTTEEMPFERHAERYPKRGILFLDEWTNTEPTIQKMLLQLLQKGMLGKERLMKGWRIVAAGNRVNDRTFSNSLSVAAATRCINIYAKAPTVQEWLAWAFRNAINESICAFLKFRPELLFKINHALYQNGELGQPMPRTWEGVSDVINEGLDQEAILPALINGLVGNAPGGEFLAFHSLRSELPNIDAILEGKASDKELKPPKKMDVQYAAVMAMGNPIK